MPPIINGRIEFLAGAGQMLRIAPALRCGFLAPGVAEHAARSPVLFVTFSHMSRATGWKPHKQ